MKKVFLAATIASLILTLTSSAFASDYVTCESGGGYRHCSVYNAIDSEVILYSKLSKAECVQGRSWGVDSRGIWVDRGCRARFEIRSDRYRDSRFGASDSYRRDHYDDYDRYSDERRRLDAERERLELERERLQLEKERAATEHAHQSKDSCPPGSRPGRCTDQQRRRGCKDFRTPSGLGCMTS